MPHNPNRPNEPTFGFPLRPSNAFVPEDLHGAARWLNREEAQAAGLLNPGGVRLGQGEESGAPLYFNGDGHLLVFSPSGGGKGIGFVLPNLLEFEGSVIVLDPKGENAATTARHRRDKLGQRVVVLDPFNKTGLGSASYNPLLLLSLTAPNELMGELRALTEALVPPRGDDETHWVNGARLFVHGLLLFLLVHEPLENRNLIRLFDLAFQTTAVMGKIFSELQSGQHSNPEIARICTAYGNWWFGRHSEELGYFLSIVHQELAWLGDTPWRGMLTSGDRIAPKITPTTVYLVLPWHLVRPYRNWLRVMVHCLIKEVTLERGKAKHGDTLFLLDEAFVGLGRLDILLDAVAILRSAGAKMALVYQDLPQLQSLFRNEWQSFFANAGAVAFWGVNDMVTARYVSERCGSETVQVSGSTTGEGKPMLRPDQVMSDLPPDKIVCFLRSHRPAKFDRLDVRHDARLDANPDHFAAVAGKAWTAQANYIPVDLTELADDQAQASDKNTWAEKVYAALSAKYEGRKIIVQADGTICYLDGQSFAVPIEQL